MRPARPLQAFVVLTSLWSDVVAKRHGLAAPLATVQDHGSVDGWLPEDHWICGPRPLPNKEDSCAKVPRDVFERGRAIHLPGASVFRYQFLVEPGTKDRGLAEQ